MSQKIVIPWFRSDNLLGNVGGEEETPSVETMFVGPSTLFFLDKDAYLGRHWMEG